MRIQRLIGLTGLFIVFAISTVAQSARDPRPRIDRVNPAEPIVGQSFDIHGEHFGDQQRRWVVYLYQPTRHRTSLTYQLRILEWTNLRIRARLPDAIPASSELLRGTRFVLQIVVPGRLLGSNKFYPNIADATRPPDISRAGQPWIRRIYTDRGRAELWIYGRDFSAPGIVNRRGVPPGVQVLIRGPGPTSRRSTQISSWRSDRVTVWPITRACEPGTYQVQIRIDADPTHWSNEMPVTLDQEFCRLANDHDARGFMHIDAFELDELGARQVPSDLPRPGDWLDIFGKYFDSDWRSDLGVYQGSRVVELVRAVRGRAHATEAPVLDVITIQRRQGVQWSDDHICVKIPADLEPDDYLLRIWDKSARRSSNTLTVRIVARFAP